MQLKPTPWLAPLLAAAVFMAIPASAPAGGGGAIVVDGQGGRILDGNGDCFSPAQFHVVLTPSKKGNVTLVLHAEVSAVSKPSMKTRVAASS